MQLHIPAIDVLCETYHIRRLSVFGSVLRDDFRLDSDVDVLVEFEPDAHTTYYELAEVQRALAELWGREVDIVTPGALNPRFRESVLQQAQVIYERER